MRERDRSGRAAGCTVDFAAIAVHLTALAESAARHGLEVERVILAPEFLPRLAVAPGGDALVRRLPWLRSEAWVRHDEHYHVDFRSAGGERPAAADCEIHGDPSTLRPVDATNGRGAVGGRYRFLTRCARTQSASCRPVQRRSATATMTFTTSSSGTSSS